MEDSNIHNGGRGWTATEAEASGGGVDRDRGQGLAGVGGYAQSVTEDKAVDSAVVSTNGVGINDGHR